MSSILSQFQLIYLTFARISAAFSDSWIKRTVLSVGGQQLAGWMDGWMAGWLVG